MSVKPTLTDELLKVNSALKLIFSVIEDQCSGGQQDRLSGTIRREIGKSSTRENNLWVNYSHFAAYVIFFSPLDYS